MPPKKTAARHTTQADTTEAVDALMASLVHPHVDAITELRRILLAVDPAIAEGVKWNAPSFRTTEYFATTHLRSKVGIGLILHRGAKARGMPLEGLAIDDPEGHLRWLGDDRAQMVFADLAELRARRGALTRIVRSWIVHV